MEHFFKVQAYSSHEFILSSGFLREKGAKVQPIALRQVSVCSSVHFLFFGSGGTHFELTCYEGQRTMESYCSSLLVFL